jgi:hypothetical protein
MAARAGEAAGFLKALSHEGRLMILCHILEGEKSVPPKDHGPIITSYKAWLADPNNQTKLKN